MLLKLCNSGMSSSLNIQPWLVSRLPGDRSEADEGDFIAEELGVVMGEEGLEEGLEEGEEGELRDLGEDGGDVFIRLLLKSLPFKSLPLESLPLRPFLDSPLQAPLAPVDAPVDTPAPSSSARS